MNTAVGQETSRTISSPLVTSEKEKQPASRSKTVTTNIILEGHPIMFPPQAIWQNHVAVSEWYLLEKELLGSNWD